MSQENVEVIRDQYAATNQRDFERVMSHYDEDVELVFNVPDIRAGTFTGREATGRWFGDWLPQFRQPRAGPRLSVIVACHCATDPSALQPDLAPSLRHGRMVGRAGLGAR
jgi:ketosteroid isomerase-like protein